MKRFMIVMLVLMLALTACNDNPNVGLIITNPAKQPFTASEVVNALSMEKIIADMTSENAAEKGIYVEYELLDGDETQGRGIVPQSDNFAGETIPGNNCIVATVEFDRYICKGVTIDGQMIILFKLSSGDSEAIESYSAFASDLTLKDGRKQSKVAITGFSGTFTSGSAFAGIVQGTGKPYVKKIESNAVSPLNNGTLTVDGETVSKAEADGVKDLAILIANSVNGVVTLAADEYTLNEAVTVDDTLTINGVEGTTIKAKATITVSATGNLTINNVDIDGSGLAGVDDRIIVVDNGTLNMNGCDVKGRGYEYGEQKTQYTAIAVALESQGSGNFNECNFSDVVCSISAGQTPNYNIVNCSGAGDGTVENGKLWICAYEAGKSVVTGFSGRIDLNNNGAVFEESVVNYFTDNNTAATVVDVNDSSNESGKIEESLQG